MGAFEGYMEALAADPEVVRVQRKIDARKGKSFSVRRYQRADGSVFEWVVPPVMTAKEQQEYERAVAKHRAALSPSTGEPDGGGK